MLRILHNRRFMEQEQHPQRPKLFELLVKYGNINLYKFATIHQMVSFDGYFHDFK